MQRDDDDVCAVGRPDGARAPMRGIGRHVHFNLLPVRVYELPLIFYPPGAVRLTIGREGRVFAIIEIHHRSWIRIVSLKPLGVRHSNSKLTAQIPFRPDLSSESLSDVRLSERLAKLFNHFAVQVGDG